MSNEKKPRRRQADRSSQAIEALRTTALDMILEGGISSLNLGAVGDQAGYSRGIVHYYFGSKEALLANILETLTLTSEATFQQFTPRGVNGILAVIDNVAASIRKQPQGVLARVMLLNEAAASNSPRLNELAIRYNETVRDAFEQWIRQEDKALLDGLGMSSDQLAVMLLALIRGIHEQWLAERTSFDVLGSLDLMRKFVQVTMLNPHVTAPAGS